MIRKLKALGLALIAVFSMSAVVASAASADDFTIGNGSATITADQKSVHTFTFTGQQLSCKIAKLEGTPGANTFTSVKLAAHYDECTGAGFSANFTNLATDHSEIGQKGKCWFRVDASGSFGIECNEADLTIHAATCVIHIPAQNFASGWTFTNVAGSNPDDVVAKFEVKEITANHTDGFLCPLTSSGHGTQGIFEGESTVIAEVGGVQVNATHNDT